MKMNDGYVNRPIARRGFLAAAGFSCMAALTGCRSGERPPAADDRVQAKKGLVLAVEAVDHLVFGFSDLDSGIAWTENNLGVRAVFGGVHPGGGTRNALLSLGGRRYLEVIAPDPAQTGVIGRFGDLSGLTVPKLVTWASATDSVEEKTRLAQAAGYRVDGPIDGSRSRPDGKILSWRTLTIAGQSGGPVPFFIEWGAGSLHPAEDSPAGCSLEDLRFEHPQPDQLKTTLANLGIDAVVNIGSSPRLIATISSPKGRVTIS